MRPILSIQWWERINAFFWCYKRAFLLVSCKLSQCGVSPTVLNQKYSRELRQICPPPQICSHAHTCCSWLGLWWWRWEWSLSRIPAYLPLRMLCKVKKKKKVFKAKYRPVQALSRREKKTNMFRPNSILQVRKPAFIRHVGASAVAWQQAVQMGSAVTRHAMQMADSVALGL